MTTNINTNDFQKELETLKKDFADLKKSGEKNLEDFKKDFVAKYEKAKGKAGDKVEEFGEEWNSYDIEDRAKKAGKNARSYLEDKQDQILEFAKCSKKAIEENPIKSALIALAAGALIVSLIKGLTLNSKE